MPGRKSNNNKSYSQHEAWEKRKRLGRPKQVWVWDTDDTRFEEARSNPATTGVFTYTQTGHWEKVSA